MVLSGKFGMWEIISADGADFYTCKCLNCGEIKQIRGYYLKRKPPKCTKCLEDKILNKTFGNLTVIEKLNNGRVRCQCSCGNLVEVHRRYLQNGTKTSCGHEKIGKTNKLIDITGNQYGTWKVICYIENKFWECECTLCGRRRSIRGHELRNGSFKPCTCQVYLQIAERNLEKYGVRSLKQLGTSRNSWQLDAISSKEKFKLAIESNFECKPTSHELGELLGIAPTSVVRFAKKYNLVDMLTLRPKISKYETEISNIFPGCIHSDRKEINGLELDLYWKDVKVALEFNGSFWHSDIFKDKYYHINKSIMAMQNKIRLIHIFEYEWLDASIKIKLIELLCTCINKIDAVNFSDENFVIKYVRLEEAKDFLDKYHLQNWKDADIVIGAYYNCELIGVMSFNTLNNCDSSYELVRICFKFGIADNETNKIASRLFKYFVDKHNPFNILSYCDISKFSGDMYRKLGFKLCGITDPNYVWVSHDSKQFLTEEQTKSGLGDISQTEDKIMKSLGYVKIYDCGNFKFKWHKGDKTS